MAAISHEAVSWVPETLFFEDNRPVIDAILAQTQRDFPESGAGQVLDPNESQPSQKAMDWMWARLMGRQHGISEGITGGKLPIMGDVEKPYHPLVDQLHYGEHGFTRPSLADPNKTITNGLILGGYPQGMVALMLAAFADDPRRGNVDTLILMTGQRTRWRTMPGERSTGDIYTHVARASGVDVDMLRETSPLVRAEERKVYDEQDIWSGPYATEFELGRLAAEAVLRQFELIKPGAEAELTADPAANPQTYEFEGEIRTVPPRDTAYATYHLNNGKRVVVLNGGITVRDRGVQRPNSESQAGELVKLGLIGADPNVKEHISVTVGLPHPRGGIDVMIPLLGHIGDRIASSQIVTRDPHTHDGMVLSALGEIPATHKADLRIRALLRGEDPNAAHLKSL